MTNELNSVASGMFAAEEVEKLELSLRSVCDFMYMMYEEGLGCGIVNNEGSRMHSYNAFEDICREFMDKMDKLLNSYGMGVLVVPPKNGKMLVSINNPEYVKQREDDEFYRLHAKCGELQLELEAAEAELKKWIENHPSKQGDKKQDSEDR